MINILSKDTIDKIAAGEVAERPSSVVKELADNSIDAGAHSVLVEIRDGGLTLIRVTDDGSGIEHRDIKNAFLRHATSKLRNSEDLLHLTTMGFRGEALASIAAVSNTELYTRVANSISGYIYKISAGKEVSFTEAGVPLGTSVIVKDFLFNVPVRRGFLKSAKMENTFTIAILNSLALAHPEINFTLIIDGKNVLLTPGNNKLKDVIYTIYGGEVTKSLLPLDVTKSDIRLTGYILKPEISRAKRDREIFSVNKRPINAEILQKAVEDAYEPYLMKHRFPFVIFDLEIAPEKIDVNVHPRKTLVRFSDSSLIYDVVYDAISGILSGGDLIPDASTRKDFVNKSTSLSMGFFPLDQKGIARAGKADEKGAQKAGQGIPGKAGQKMPETRGQEINGKVPEKISESPANYHFEPYETNARKDYESSLKDMISPDKKEKESGESFLTEGRESFLKTSKGEIDSLNIKIIGQVFDTYWIIEYGDCIYMVDQHSAHEKVNYEKFIKLIFNGQVESQMLYPPIVLTLDFKEALLLEKNLEQFALAGYEIDHAGDRDFIVRSVPSNLPDIGDEKILKGFIEELFEEGKNIQSSLIKEKIASVSCKAAVKGGNNMSEAEMRELIKELMKLENPYTCPHGRPTMIRWSKYELDRLFKRIV